MKKIITVICTLVSLSISAVTVNDVAGTFRGTLMIDDEAYQNEKIYILPGTASNTITFVLPDFKFNGAPLGDIVLVNVPMSNDGTLTISESSLYIKAIQARASISSTGSTLSASAAEIGLSIDVASVPMPIPVTFSGSKVTSDNYAITNGGFEGNWSNNEPQGWHSFPSATGSYASFVTGNTGQFQQSTDKRPGSTGSHSAQIQSKTTFGVKANGNCTNGRINAGSMSADDASGNYSFSEPGSGYTTSFVGCPDSLVFWAKYIPGGGDVNADSNKARAHAVLTTNARYQDPETSDYSSIKIAEATANYKATASKGWQRISVPFVYTNVSPSQMAYMLLTFSTNQTPGGGNSTKKSPDNVYIDDAEMIYNHSLSSLKLDGETVSFTNGQATSDKMYSDSEYSVSATTNGKAAKSFIGYDAATYSMYIYVVADNYSQAYAYSVYSIQMAEPIRDTEFAYAASTCDNVPYSDALFHNLTQSGIYDTIIPNTRGGDSLITLTLTVNPTYIFPTSRTMKMNEHYIWREHTYEGFTPGVYTFADSLQTQAGCDSVFTLSLTVEAIGYLLEESATACQNEASEWHGKMLPTGQAGTFIVYDSLLSQYGMDSVYKLTLTVNPTYAFPTSVTMKMNEHYIWREHTYEGLTPGVYTFADSLQTQAGCDSVFTLSLTVQSIGYWYEETLSGCVNEESEWHGKVLPTGQAGTFIVYDSLLSQYGMDSVYKLTLTVHPTYLFTEEKYVNEANLEWRGKTIHDLPKREEPYLIYDSLSSQYGCDSVYMLTLHVSDLPITYGSYSDACCEGESIVFDGAEYRESFEGDVRISERNVYGGDSIVHLTITVLPSYYIEDSMTIYLGDARSWEYYELSQFPLGTTTLTAEYWSDDFCDSIRVLHLTVEPQPINTGLDDAERDNIQCKKIVRDGVIYVRRNKSLYNIIGNKIQ